VHSCTHWLRNRNLLPHSSFGLIYEGVIGQPRKTTSLCDPLMLSFSEIQYLLYVHEYCRTKYLGSLCLISLPSLNHLTLALGSSTLHLSSSFLFVLPFLSFSFPQNPNSGSAAAQQTYFNMVYRVPFSSLQNSSDDFSDPINQQLEFFSWLFLEHLLNGDFKGTVSQVEGLNIEISTFCVYADGFDGLSKAFTRIIPCSIINFFIFF
jgi:hypothetical protein